MSNDRLNYLIEERNTNREAIFQGDLEQSRTRKTPKFFPMTIALDTARTEGNALKVLFPYLGIYVAEATDSSTKIYLSFDSQDSKSIAEAIPLSIKDAFNLKGTVATSYLTWPAQAGKSIQVFFITEGEFNSGSMLSVSAGGVSITTGDTVTTQATATVTISAAVLFSSDSARKKMFIQNLGSFPIFLGSLGVTDDTGAFCGIKVDSGESIEWDSTAACYAIAKGGSSIVSLNKFK